MDATKTTRVFYGMDENSLINHNNHQKNDDDDDDEGKGDNGMRLSDLPDVILQEIISNLPTKYAVRTSVLSKRWVNIWKGISKIELEELEPEKRQSFIDFVEKLLVISKSLHIKKISLIFEVGEDASVVSEWLRVFANPNKIEEVNLDLESVQQPLVFPEHFFSSQTLINLKLSMEQVFNIPSSVNFQSLVFLTLKHVTFSNGASVQQLFCGCQFLKELTLIDCNWTNVSIVCIVCPLLEKLIIREWADDDDDGLHEHEGEHVDHIVPIVPYVPGHCQIMIFVNNLKTYSYDGDLINDYFLSCTNSVVNATIEVNPPENINRNASYFVFNLLKTLSNVEKLTLSSYAVEALSSAPYLTVDIPVFHQLVELCVGSTSPVHLASLALQAILHRSPILEEVYFVVGVSLDEAGTNDIGLLPACFGTHLKTITTCGFRGDEGELNAIKFLLQTTPVLDTLDIYSNPYVFYSSKGTKRLKRLFKKIVEFPTASRDIKIKLRIKNIQGRQE